MLVEDQWCGHNGSKVVVWCGFVQRKCISEKSEHQSGIGVSEGALCWAI